FWPITANANIRSNGPSSTRRMWGTMKDWTLIRIWTRMRARTLLRESPKNKQTDGSTRNRPFVILSWKGKGRAHILYRSSAETILSGQPFPVSGYCFADLLCSLFRFLRGQAEIIGYFQSQFQVNGVIILTHIEGKPVPRGDRLSLNVSEYDNTIEGK